MKYLENLGLGKGNIINLDDLQNNMLGVNITNDWFSSNILAGIAWNSIGNIEEDESFKKTNEGNKFYEDIKEFVSSTEFSKRFFKTSDRSFIDMKNDNIKNRAMRIYEFMFYQDKAFDTNHILKYSVLLPYFIAYHFFDFFGKYGYDVKINNSKKNSDQDFFNMFSSNIISKTLLERQQLDLVYKTANGIDYYRNLDENALKKISNILDEIYEVYIKSFENHKTYSLEQFKAMIKNLRLLEIDIDEILNKYQNITKEDIYKLLIYNTNSSNFDSYLNVLNVCSNEVKQKVFEFIKPSIYYYDSYPNNFVFHYGDSYTDNFYRIYCCVDNFYPLITRFLVNNFYNSKKEFAFSLDTTKNFLTEKKKILIKRYFEYMFEKVLFNGYMDFVLSFQDAFVNQIDVIEKIFFDNDLSKLDTLLQMKQKILLNPIKTKWDFCSSEIKTDDTKIIEVKDAFETACKELVNAKSKSLKK